MRLVAVLTSSFVVSALFGCEHSPRPTAAHRSPTSVAFPTPSVTPSAAVPVPAVCRRVSDCRLELVADIDGDGKRDQVAVVGRRQQNGSGGYWGPESKPRLRVLLGSAQILTYQVRIGAYSGVLGHLVRGAASLDGVRGDEVLVGYADGVHGTPQTVVTLRYGRLVPLASPDPYSGEPGDVLGSWGADSSIQSDLGWRCLPGARVEEYTAFGEDTQKGDIKYTLTRRTWRWTSRGWRPVTPRITRRHRPASEITDRYVDWTDCGTFSRYRD